MSSLLLPLVLLAQYSSAVWPAPLLAVSPTLTFDVTAPPIEPDGYSFVPTQPVRADESRAEPRLFFATDDQTSPPPTVAIEYSHGYEVRLRVHRYASYAMLPIFVTEAIVGEKLLHDPLSRGLKTEHAWLNVGVFGLFAVDSVTGIWNLEESWHDPHGRALRLTHALLMLTADGGFLATALTAPRSRNVAVDTNVGTTHRNLAITSISVATVGYLIMVFR